MQLIYMHEFDLVSNCNIYKLKIFSLCVTLLNSFSWSQALQLPLLQLCEGKGKLQLDVMVELYLRELKMASAAALGKWEGDQSSGNHIGVVDK